MTTLDLNAQAKTVLSICTRSQDAIDKQGKKTSDLILELFKAAGNGKDFKAACTTAEGDWKGKRVNAGKDDNLPRCWLQAKSDLVSADKAGIDVTKAVSVSAAKRDKIKANKAKADAVKTNAEKVEAGKSDDDATLSNNKLIQLAEKLETLSPLMREAMMDAFLTQADQAIATMAATGDVVYSKAKDVTPVSKVA
jgi:hypothetical protein